MRVGSATVAASVLFLHPQEIMAETLAHFMTPISTPDGLLSFEAQACGEEDADGLWRAWIEFTPLGRGRKFRTGRETTQPNRLDARYWALGLTQIYLEGALNRAMEGPSIPFRMRRSPRGYLIIDRRARHRP